MAAGGGQRRPEDECACEVGHDASDRSTAALRTADGWLVATPAASRATSGGRLALRRRRRGGRAPCASRAWAACSWRSVMRWAARAWLRPVLVVHAVSPSGCLGLAFRWPGAVLPGLSAMGCPTDGPTASAEWGRGRLEPSSRARLAMTMAKTRARAANRARPLQISSPAEPATPVDTGAASRAAWRPPLLGGAAPVAAIPAANSVVGPGRSPVGARWPPGGSTTNWGVQPFPGVAW